MANGTFFTSWQLWEEMTFVLAMGIVAVFLIGLAKLWVTNRHMRKIEELDAEKQARILQMRKSGLSASGRFRLGSEIPFGVKALESGVEVDGIWVARMASMASRPPDRKWSSRRKIRAPPASLLEMSDPGSPSKRARRGSRGSRGASIISRREIMKPSTQTRGKLEKLSLLEEERQSRDLTGKDEDRALVEGMDDEHARTSQLGHKGTLGRIQRGLKRMTSSETWQDQERKKTQGGKRLDAREFHRKAQAKKPQRFYPTSPTAARSAVATTTTTPIVAPQARSQVTRQQVNSLLSAHGLTPVDEAPAESRHQVLPHSSTSDSSFAARQASALRQQATNSSTPSSVDPSVTIVKAPKESPSLSRQPGQQPRVSGDGGDGLRERPKIGPRRSSLRKSQDRAHRRSAEGRCSLDGTNEVAAQVVATTNAPPNRYPPNSSRSGPATRRRSQSSEKHQEQQQQQQQTASTPPSPAFGPGDVYLNTTKRKVNAGFELLPAGTFDFPQEQQQYVPVATDEPASAGASARSSFDSQSSGGRKKLRKKRISQS